MTRAVALALSLQLLSSACSAAPPAGTTIDPSSPVAQWFARHVKCCSVADGHVLETDEWRVTSDGAYEFLSSGTWIRVDPHKIVDTRSDPMPLHKAVVWYWMFDRTVPVVFCFVPGPLL